MRDEITPLILTYNEAANIERTLKTLDWAKEIVVVDSGSSDGTIELLAKYPNIRVIQRQFDHHACQRNYGIDQITTPWVLSLDADYVLTLDLIEELKSLKLASSIVAYSAAFQYVVFGRPLRGSLYPDRIVLFRRDTCRYVPDGHGEQLCVQGPIARLKARINHDDRKPLSCWLDAQRRYVILEADHLLSCDVTMLSWSDRLRYWIWPAAPLVCVYTLVIKGCIFDGWRGWYYALQRMHAEVLLSLELLERWLGRWQSPGSEEAPLAE